MKKYSNIKFEGPALYSISISGKLNQRFKEQFELIKLQEELKNGETLHTTFICSIQDQATLSGLLNRLYSLHHSIINVTCIGNK